MPNDRTQMDTPSGDTSKGQASRKRSIVELSAPWGGQQRMRQVQQCRSSQDSDGGEFVRERSRVHELFIREDARNKRIGLVLAFTLIVLAALVIVFAPEGRQTLSYWIGAALVIFAAGAAGFGRIWARTGPISFGADQDKRDLR